jgi:hypothetical protein
MKEIPQNYDKKISKLLAEMVDCTFVSEKGHGKTVASMDLAQKIIENPSNRLIVFESFPKWSIEFKDAKFLEIPKSWIVETEKAIDLQNTWIRHETAFSVLHGDIISQFLKENKHATFLLNNDDIEAIAFFIYSVIYKYYRLRYDMLRKGYPINERIYFILEEAQNSLSAQVLSSKLFRRYRKLFSEMRNMGLYAILITQRIQDISTYFRCRSSLGIGKVALDDWDLKIKRLLSPIKDKERILDMPKGSFYFTAINDIIAFPMFKPSKPIEYKPKIEQKPIEQPQKKSIIQKIAFAVNVIINPSANLPKFKATANRNLTTENTETEQEESELDKFEKESEEFDLESIEEGYIE